MLTIIADIRFFDPKKEQISEGFSMLAWLCKPVAGRHKGKPVLLLNRHKLRRGGLFLLNQERRGGGRIVTTLKVVLVNSLLTMRGKGGFTMGGIYSEHNNTQYFFV